MIIPNNRTTPKITGSKNFVPFHNPDADWFTANQRRRKTINDRLLGAIKNRAEKIDKYKATFTVSSDWTGKTRRVEVLVHETVESLRHDAGAGHEESYALTASENEEVTLHFVDGIVSLGHVAHEVAHAALELYSIDILSGSPYARAHSHINMKNETLPYLIGNLTEQVVDGLAAKCIELHPTHEGE